MFGASSTLRCRLLYCSILLPAIKLHRLLHARAIFLSFSFAWNFFLLSLHTFCRFYFFLFQFFFCVGKQFRSSRRRVNAASFGASSTLRCLFHFVSYTYIVLSFCLRSICIVCFTRVQFSSRFRSPGIRLLSRHTFCRFYFTIVFFLFREKHFQSSRRRVNAASVV